MHCIKKNDGNSNWTFFITVYSSVVCSLCCNFCVCMCVCVCVHIHIVWSKGAISLFLFALFALMKCICCTSIAYRHFVYRYIFNFLSENQILDDILFCVHSVLIPCFTSHHSSCTVWSINILPFISDSCAYIS